MYVCMYVYIYIYIYIHRYTHMCVCIYIYICIYTYVCIAHARGPGVCAVALEHVAAVDDHGAPMCYIGNGDFCPAKGVFCPSFPWMVYFILRMVCFSPLHGVCSPAKGVLEYLRESRSRRTRVRSRAPALRRKCFKFAIQSSILGRHDSNIASVYIYTKTFRNVIGIKARVS